MREEQFHAAIGNRAVPPPHLRFGVYRNNVASALINALRVRFPVTAALLGATAFAARAGEYALANLPVSPVLINYGAGFADEVDEPIASVARLENLWWNAYHAAEAMAAEPGILANRDPVDLAELRFTFHPSFGLMSSASNTGTVWQAARDGQSAMFEPVPQYLLVARPEADVEVKSIPLSSRDFIAALAAGKTLAEAFEHCTGTHGDFDLARELGALLSHRIIIGA